MNDEQQNLMVSRATTAPPGLGWTVLVRSDSDPNYVVGRFREVWNVVASWGTWRDQSPGWPEDGELLKQLPAWFSDRLRVDHAVDISNWLDDLHDRSWIVWSLSTEDDLIKLDLSADSLPLSPWPVHLVFDILGACVVSSDIWTAAFDTEARESPHTAHGDS